MIDRLYIAYQEINLTQTFDIYLSGILRSETASRMGGLPAQYQQMFEIQSIKFENTSSKYNLTGKLEYNYKNQDEKTQLYKMFIAYNCNGRTTAPLTQYKNNEIYKEITPEDEYRDNAKDDRIYLDMRRSQGYTDKLEKLTRDDSGPAVVINLKEAAKKKMRLRITGFSQAEY